MSGRRFASAAAVLVALAIVSLASVQVAGQAPAKAKTSAAPRTAEGQPDLQGVWSYATITPLERPGALAGKAEFATEEEAAEFERTTVRQRDQDRRDPGTQADVSRAYNQFWWDFGNTIVGKQTSLIVAPADGRVPALMPEAATREAARAEARRQRGPADAPEDRSLWERCIMRALPTLPGPYNNNIQLFQFKDHVVILNEMIHEARIIPLGNRPHGTVRQWHGDSRAHWEKHTLVVDTINFTNKTNFRGSGENLHLVERYTRVDPRVLLYEVTIEDATTWMKPWTVSIPMTRSDGEIYESACHEANYGLAGILRGARAEEKAAATKTSSR